MLAAPTSASAARAGSRAFVEGATAGAVGALAGPVVVSARRLLIVPIAIGIARVSLTILLFVKRLLSKALARQPGQVYSVESAIHERSPIFHVAIATAGGGHVNIDIESGT